jgi:hypothetical protein
VKVSVTCSVAIPMAGRSGGFKISIVDDLVVVLSLLHELCHDHATSQLILQCGVPHKDTCNHTSFVLEQISN